jgi:cytochrome P450
MTRGARSTASHLGLDISLAELVSDPYPIYRSLRESDPVAWVPAANRYLVTRYKDVLQIERNAEIFSSAESDSLMLRAIGQAMLRLDGAAHKRIRAALEPSLRQAVIRDGWAAEFQRVVDERLDELVDRGHMDIVEDFAGPCAAACLARLLGLRDCTEADLRRWSQGIIDGCGNYGDDSAVWARCERGKQEVQCVLTDLVPALRKSPDGSIVSALAQSPETFTAEEIRANVMVTIGGGINEPRDVIATAVYALLKQPEQREMVAADASLWMSVFDEAVRWVSPVGMYPRQTTRRTTLGDAVIEAGSRIGVMVGAANRDETVFDDPDVFDIRRAKRPHLAFGGGVHYCLGAWAARVQVANAALPTLFRRLRNLRLAEAPAVKWSGWVFRGPLIVPVEWDP